MTTLHLVHGFGRVSSVTLLLPHCMHLGNSLNVLQSVYIPAPLIVCRGLIGATRPPNKDPIKEVERKKPRLKDRKKLFVQQKGKSFVDFRVVKVVAGSGGNGCSSFRREKYTPFGGPDGGNGGAGGDIYLKAVHELSTLSGVEVSYRGKNGMPGSGSLCAGRNGEDTTIMVPVGTIVREPNTGVVKDFDLDGSTIKLVKGGPGGFGNRHFKTGEDTAPRMSTKGKSGEERNLTLELKTIADVGLVGIPNAGKSSFLSAVTNAHPMIASYPFTTLNPHLGVLDFKDHFRLTLADIPGLIRGAHRNLGLGHSFLRHIERSKVLMYIIDISKHMAIPGETEGDGRTPWGDLRDLQSELELYRPEMTNRPSIVVANKIDLEGAEDNLHELRKHTNLRIVGVSALHRTNIDKAGRLVRDIVSEMRGK